MKDIENGPYCILPWPFIIQEASGCRQELGGIFTHSPKCPSYFPPNGFGRRSHEAPCSVCMVIKRHRPTCEVTSNLIRQFKASSSPMCCTKNVLGWRARKRFHRAHGPLALQVSECRSDMVSPERPRWLPTDLLIFLRGCISLFTIIHSMENDRHCRRGPKFRRRDLR